jgi:hypothetical protein
MVYVRGSNPVWFNVDLSAHAFDDSYYMFVLENTIPYIPATVYTTPFGTPWSQPIRFLANGTLPTNIFFDPDKVYRLEFRQGNTQNDPLIYSIENYIPGGSDGNNPQTGVVIPTDNQITNPQFSIINFNSPFTITGGAAQIINIAPGWFLDLTGTGNLTVTRVPLNSSATTINPTNAPYALRLQIGAWSTATLRQRFDQAGMLWANKTVSSSVTARVDGASVFISAKLKDSNGTDLTTVLASTPINGTFNEYKDNGQLPAPTNTNIPPAAYIDYLMTLPVNSDIYLTSFQLVASDFEIDFAYDQDTVERQVDNTFHYYKNSILLMPKESILTGWNFAQNAWQAQTTAQSNIANNFYTADQTIIIQQAFVTSATGNNVSVGRGTFAQNYGFKVQAVTATNQFAILQYIAPQTSRPYWGSKMSSVVKLTALKQNAGNVLRVKMRLLYRSLLPSAVSQTEPVTTWTALGEPSVYAAGWVALAPKNDPVYNIVNGENTLIFEGIELPVSQNDQMTLGILIYTLNPMVETGTPDYIMFNKISLVPNDFAIDCNVLTFDQALNQQQFYYSKSFPLNVVPNFNSSLVFYEFPQTVAGSTRGIGAQVQFPVRMCRTPNPGVILYNPNANNNQIRNTSFGNCTLSSATNISDESFSPEYTSPAGSAVGNGLIFQWSADARLGV